MDYRPVGFHEFRKSTLNTDFKAYRGCEECENTALEKGPVASGKHLVFDKAERGFPGRERPGRSSLNKTTLKESFHCLLPTFPQGVTQLIQSWRPEKATIVSVRFAGSASPLSQGI